MGKPYPAVKSPLQFVFRIPVKIAPGQIGKTIGTKHLLAFYQCPFASLAVGGVKQADEITKNFCQTYLHLKSPLNYLAGTYAHNPSSANWRIVPLIRLDIKFKTYKTKDPNSTHQPITNQQPYFSHCFDKITINGSGDFR